MLWSKFALEWGVLLILKLKKIHIGKISIFQKNLITCYFLSTHELSFLDNNSYWFSLTLFKEILFKFSSTQIFQNTSYITPKIPWDQKLVDCSLSNLSKKNHFFSIFSCRWVDYIFHKLSRNTKHVKFQLCMSPWWSFVQSWF
jgi:hypothetical protein